LENLGVDERIILKRIIKEIEYEGANWIYLTVRLELNGKFF
jgi:hypothetical protein